MRARNADIKLSKSSGKPDLNLGAGYRRLHDDGSNSFLVWASVPIPLFNRNKGGVAEATARLTQSEAELDATRQRLNGELRQLLVGLQTQRELIVMLREQVIPPAQQAMEEIDLAYRLGSQPYINVLDAQRTLSELQGQLIDALVAGANAAIGIEQLTGHRMNPVRR
jgi:cobalt-zinc-cadmium efflux system outer membrane protein